MILQIASTNISACWSNLIQLHVLVEFTYWEQSSNKHTRFLVNKTNGCTEFQFYWYYYSTCFGKPFCPSSGVLSCISALVHFMQLWPFATRSRTTLSAILLLVANGSSQLHKMYQRQHMAKNSWCWAERLPETRRVVIPIKLEFSASVGFIHKESVTMHGHKTVKHTHTHTHTYTHIHTHSLYQPVAPASLVTPVLCWWWQSPRWRHPTARS